MSSLERAFAAIFVERTGINTDPPANEADGRSGVRERDALQERSDVLLGLVYVASRTLRHNLEGLKSFSGVKLPQEVIRTSLCVFVRKNLRR